MLKKIIQVSSLVFTLAVASGISANAASANEEDAAAPVGSFTSAMDVPAGPHFDAAAHRLARERFLMRMREERFAQARAMRQDGEQQR